MFPNIPTTTPINFHQGHKKIINNFLKKYEFYRYFSPGWMVEDGYMHRIYTIYNIVIPAPHNISDGNQNEMFPVK